jgi:hypothetical protein
LPPKALGQTSTKSVGDSGLRSNAVIGVSTGRPQAMSMQVAQLIFAKGWAEIAYPLVRSIA